MDRLLDSSLKMFENLKAVNKLVALQMTEIETRVTQSEAIFVDEFHLLLKNRKEFNSLQKKVGYKSQTLESTILPV